MRCFLCTFVAAGLLATGAFACNGSGGRMASGDTGLALSSGRSTDSGGTSLGSSRIRSTSAALEAAVQQLASEQILRRQMQQQLLAERQQMLQQQASEMATARAEQAKQARADKIARRKAREAEKLARRDELKARNLAKRAMAATSTPLATNP